MATISKALYDTDFVEWTAHNAELLRHGRFEELDLEHVAEEIEDFRKARPAGSAISIATHADAFD